LTDVCEEEEEEEARGSRASIDEDRRRFSRLACAGGKSGDKGSSGRRGGIKAAPPWSRTKSRSFSIVRRLRGPRSYHRLGAYMRRLLVTPFRISRSEASVTASAPRGEEERILRAKSHRTTMAGVPANRITPWPLSHSTDRLIYAARSFFSLFLNMLSMYLKASGRFVLVPSAHNLASVTQLLRRVPPPQQTHSKHTRTRRVRVRQ
jgi:hypothetical protein